MKSRSCKLFLRLLHLVQFVKCWQLFLELSSKDCIEVQEKKKEVVVLCSLPPQKVKLGRHRDGKEMYQKSDACAKLLLCHFLPFSLTSPSWSLISSFVLPRSVLKDPNMLGLSTRLCAALFIFK